MRACLAVLLCFLAACAPGGYDGLAPANAAGGPSVRFDLAGQPFAEIPFPNDLLTRPDPKSATGLRVDAALVAPTALEGGQRALLDQLDGFGTYAPISVSFDQDLDVLDLFARQNDSDPSNDAVLLIDLADGTRWPLDFGGGHFPYELPRPAPYFLADPLAATTNLLFPVDPAAPSGPNFLHPPDPAWAASHGGVPQPSDDLLGFYERATRTLLVRPVLPLPQQHRFAVVLTRRLRGLDGRPVGSPFSGINHALQTAELSALPRLLPQGTALQDVAFTWAFTTQSVTRELEAVRDGLYGRGRLADLSRRFAVQQATVDPLFGVTGVYTRMTIARVDDQNPNPYVLTSARFRQLLDDPTLSGLLFAGARGPGTLDALKASLQSVDYLVFGTFVSPDLLADRDRPSGDRTFQIDLSRGLTRAVDGRIPFVLAVPVTDPVRLRTPPFPVALVAPGFRSSRFEGITQFAGTLARFGVASIAIDAYGDGLGLPPLSTPAAPVSEQAVQAALARIPGLAPLADALLATRARDLDHDGIRDPGGDLFGGNPFHTRDVIRQSVVDWMQLSRVLRTFNGLSLMTTPPDPKTGARLAGDFNNDGIPDVGGPALWPADVVVNGAKLFVAGARNPGADTFALGTSLGGILTGILAAVEPQIAAAAPVSGAGGLADLGLRSGAAQVRVPFHLEVFGPILATCSWSATDGACGGANGRPSLVWDALDVDREAAVPVAPLALSPGDTVTACNLAQARSLPSDAQLARTPATGCRSAVADASGNVRLSLAADGPQLFVQESRADAGTLPPVSVQVVQPGDPIHVVVTRAAGAAPLSIDSFGYDAAFNGVRYAAGSPLRAVSRGFGADRNTPAFRRLWSLSQTALEPADPVDYAPHWFGDPLPGRRGLPANVLLIATSGDPDVPVGTGVALGRAAGLVELAQPDPAYGMTDDRVLIAGGVVEGVSRLRRFASTDPGTPRALLAGHVDCNGAGSCDGDAVLDPSGLACDFSADGGIATVDGGTTPDGGNCTDGIAAPRLYPPLRDRLSRITRTPDGNAHGTSALLLPLLSRAGQGAFGAPQPAKAFNMDAFLANVIGYYFQTRGTVLDYRRCQAAAPALASDGGVVPPDVNGECRYPPP
ncbi:MAG: hypothetical protein NVSMB23_07100 [Myxococcales bacterium]